MKYTLCEKIPHPITKTFYIYEPVKTLRIGTTYFLCKKLIAPHDNKAFIWVPKEGA